MAAVMQDTKGTEDHLERLGFTEDQIAYLLEEAQVHGQVETKSPLSRRKVTLVADPESDYWIMYT